MNTNRDKEYWIDLLKKYEAGNCTDEELAILEEMYGRLSEIKPLPDADPAIVQKGEKILNHILKPTPVKRIRKYGAVAAALLLLGVGGWYMFKIQSSYTTVQTGYNEEAHARIGQPGGTYASLTLSNGEVIQLDKQGIGELKNGMGLNLQKTAEGKIVVSVDPNNKNLEKQVLNTPAGGQYEVVLSDGTVVVLNAMSSITFPTSFEKAETREVKVRGEVYFKVAKDKNKPFVVHTANQSLQVLGTEFNVNAYPDENSIVSTLVEGAVKVWNGAEADRSILLKPGERTVNKGGKLKVEKANIEAATAWKNNYFYMADMDLEVFMRQVSRWYGLEVVYQGEKPKVTLIGKIRRSANINEVISLLDFLKIETTLDNNKLFVHMKE